MKSDFTYSLDNAGWPVLLVDAWSRIARANSAASSLFGFQAGQELPVLSAIWSPQNHTRAEDFLDDWERAPKPIANLSFRNAAREVVTFQVCICVVFGQGQKHYVFQLVPGAAAQVAGTAVQAPGAATQAAGAATQVPAAAAQAVETKEAETETGFSHKQKLECALQLARTVALDFNNALTSILGHTSLLLGKAEPTHPWRTSLLEVEKSAAKAAEISNDLGMFSRQEKETRGQSSGNLNLLLQRTVEVFQQNSDGQPVQWQLQFERNLFTARFEEAKMQQAFMKILENSVQSLNGPGRITLQTKNLELPQATQDRNVQLAPGAYVMIEISDSGGGIAAEVLPRVFEPFFTTKGGAHRGLGLAWVYGIVTNHGGGVAISSERGTGTSVRIYLPAESRVVKEDGTQHTSLHGTETVLIVDDDDLLLTMGRTILSSFGYKVLTANSGQAALETLAGPEKIHLVITDLVMPSMSGRELVEHIQRMVPGMAVLCTSGYVWQGTQETEGCYLQKPYTAQDLLLKVKQTLTGI